MQNSDDFSVKEINNGETFIVDANKVDCDEKFIYVHVVKAKGLGLTTTRQRNTLVQIKIGNVKKSTDSDYCGEMSDPEWNRVIAFTEDELSASSVLEVRVKQDGRLHGSCFFQFDEIPQRVPSNCTVAPRWYKLQNKNEEWLQKEIMLAVFCGYQGNEQWNLDAVRDKGTDALTDIPSMLYFSPKLWYLRVSVIGAYDLMPARMNLSRDPRFFVRASLGKHTLQTGRVSGRNPKWNEDLMLITAEPFEEPLIIRVEDNFQSSSTSCVGACVIPLKDIQRRSDDKAVNAICHTLETGDPRVVSSIEMRVCLEGGYNVQYESANYTSDFRPTDTKLWKPKIGVLELGILRATSLMPAKTSDSQQTTNAYCVAKYGQKWVRTRTIHGSCGPMWNEVFRWNVYDPYTVVTVGLFDSSQMHGAGARDSRLGKVRIRLSTLQTGRVYTHSYPLFVIHINGVKRMGEIELAVRFNCSSWLKLMHTYSQPLQPKMHYIRPIDFGVSETLRRRALEIVFMRLSRSEPPLEKDVVDYILDLESHSWSLRRARINYSRIRDIYFRSYNFIDGIVKWNSTPKTLLAFFCIMVCIFFPYMALLFLPLFVFFTGLFFYFGSSDLPSKIDIPFSQASSTAEEVLEEEFDTYPSSREPITVSNRYDYLRRLAGVSQTSLGHVSALMEKLPFLFQWRDRRATALFLVSCLLAGILLLLLWLLSRYLYSRYMYHVPLLQVLQVFVVLYLMRPRRFRKVELPWLLNFFWRLPGRHDDLL